MTARLALAATAFVLAACTPPASEPETPPAPVVVNAPSGEYALDPNHTSVTVRVSHFGLSHYTLRFNTASGTLNFNAEDPAQSSIEASVATTSLDTPYGGPRDFDAELQNSEWLDSASFPAATFRSTAVEQTGPGAANVTGDLTIRGVTHPITLAVTYNASHSPHPMGVQISLIGFSARGTFNRSDYGLNVLQPTAGANDGVSNDVELIIEAEFTRPIENTPAPANTPAEPVN
ncbi:MAG: YceI family protein [Hyphomonadaceae bacterium]